MGKEAVSDSHRHVVSEQHSIRNELNDAVVLLQFRCATHFIIIFLTELNRNFSRAAADFDVWKKEATMLTQSDRDRQA